MKVHSRNDILQSIFLILQLFVLFQDSSISLEIWADSKVALSVEVLFHSSESPFLNLIVTLFSKIICSKTLLMAACCAQGPKVPSSRVLIHLSFKRVLLSLGQVLDTLGEFHCFVPLTPALKHPGSLPLWEGIFLAGPFLSVLCHLSQGSLLRG